ncbi:FAD-dependent oxidoreductase [Segniliparus rotundus]|nr:NAD(P)-binding protein [Segniliparus rotundus]
MYQGCGQSTQALVVGSGMAGLLAARVLADHFTRVVIVEQDEITSDTDYRRSVPQARHPHGMLKRGADIFERLFPGLQAELVSEGAPIIDFGKDPFYLFPTGLAPRAATGIHVQMVTRGTLERHVRRRVLALPQVTLRSGWHVDDLVWNEQSAQLIGVRITPTKPLCDAASPSECVEARLVICSTGRTSTISDWLERAGYGTPRSLRVNGRMSYSSRLIKPSASVGGCVRADAQLTFAPWTRRGGTAITVEGGQQLLTLLGADGELPPNNSEAFYSYAQSLQHPGIHAALTEAATLGPIYRMINCNNTWTLFHRMSYWPERLIVMGDAYCTFNPVYGQGMTVAAIEADLLDKLLRKRKSDDLSGLARNFHRRAARAIRVPWMLTTSTDLRWTPEQQNLTTRLIHWYTDQLLRAIPGRPHVYRRFLQATQLTRSPAVLLHPRVISAVAGVLARKCLGTQTEEGA